MKCYSTTHVHLANDVDTEGEEFDDDVLLNTCF